MLSLSKKSQDLIRFLGNILKGIKGEIYIVIPNDISYYVSKETKGFLEIKRGG